MNSSKSTVFRLLYKEVLVNFFTFLQTAVYNIDFGLTSESPRVKELHAKLLKQVTFESVVKFCMQTASL